MKSAKKKVPLREFFAALDHRLEGSMPDGGYRFQVKVCGQIIELQFPGSEQAALMEKVLAGRVTREGGPPNAVFRFWMDDLTRYIGGDSISARLHARDDNGCMIYTPECWLAGARRSDRTFYYCRHSLEKNGAIPYWAMTMLFYQWARMSDLLLLHSAAVGVNGKGVLIAARGGGGKSTLSIACLLRGMDFAGDDHVLVNQSGPLRAMPLHTAVKLNPDMAELLNPDMPVIWTDESRNGKLVLDASGRRFCPEIAIGAIVSPVFAEDGEPRVVAAQSGPVLTRLIHSTIQSIGLFHDPEPVRAMADRLAGLPVYELRLSRDLQKNAEVLRRFIERDV